MQTVTFPTPPRSASSRSNDRGANRKPTPSPLQVSQISSPVADTFVQTSPKDVESPSSSRGGSGNSYSPRSLHESPAFDQPSALALQERGPVLRSSKPRHESKDSDTVPGMGKSSLLMTPKVDSQRQARNVSAPVPSSDKVTDSPPHVPSDLSNLRAKSSIGRAEARLIPRTSSLDSTMSSTSSTPSLSQPTMVDQMSPKPEEIVQMIANAGSPEALISQLLKEKKHAAAQNSQLFRLVQKQRSLMAGMKADLDHALQEKDAYRKRLKEQMPGKNAAPVASASVNALHLQSRAESVSSAQSEDELPIQRHSVTDDRISDKSGRGIPTEVSKMKKELSNRPSNSGLRLANSLSQSSSSAQGFPANSGNLGTLQPQENRSRRTTMSPVASVAPLEILKRTSPEPMQVSQNTDGLDGVPSPSSFAARRSFTGRAKLSGMSPLTGTGSPTNEIASGSPVARKGPPAPLNLHAQKTPEFPLAKSPEEYGPNDHTDSEYGDLEVDELPAFERGRKKTREEDDREREMIMMKEQESRSLSKKKSRSAKSSPHEAVTSAQPLPKSPAFKAFAPTSPPGSRHDHLSPHASLAGVLSGPPSSNGSIVERTVTISPPPMSPGLPVSPRPVNRPTNAATLPRSPRDGFSSPLSSPNLQGTQQLSPRPPRHPIPLPSHTPSSLSPPPNIQEQNVRSRSPALQPASIPQQSKSQAVELKPSVAGSPAVQPPESPSSPKRTSTEIKIDTSVPSHRPSLSEMSLGGVNKSLVSDAYPNLLLPPNAIPSIMITVTSSRLKPSRNSTISPKGLEEEPVFTLGVIQRAGMKQLWRVEKNILSLPELDRQFKLVCSFDVKLPDKSLFAGQSPAKIDARREALEKYFESLLETQMNEKAALIICSYLSSQVISAEDQEGMKATGRSDKHQSPVNVGPDGKIVKEGYLTKRGKQFGGWKARFFVLDEPILRYYDAPGGSLQGTIKLTNAQIGRQQAQPQHSPTRNEDPDSQFRHAFLILEPKKKDSNSHMKHVLCAENDQERDEWVFALLQYVGMPIPERKTSGPVRSNSDSKASATKKDSPPASESAKADSFDTLQGTSYEETLYAHPPTRVAPVPPLQSASPMKPSFTSSSSGGTGPQSAVKAISRPSNATVIQDVSAWGNKAPASPRSKDKEKKTRSIWGFRDKAAEVVANHGHLHHGSANGPNVAASSGQTAQIAVRPVFGIPLPEAVQYCPPRGVNVPLPSVVYRCIEYLEAKGAANEEGIFRLSGSNVVIRQLKEKFNNEGDFDFLADDTYYDIHAVAGLLKMYLRELPNMVLTRDLHMEFLRYMELDDKPSKIAGYNFLVHQLPLANWTLVRALSRFLIGIVNNAHVNKMSVRNVGIVFAPTLNMPAPVFACFLTDFDAIFTVKPPGERTEPLAPSPLTPEDIRSPRRQIFSDIQTPSYAQDGFPTTGQPYESITRSQHSVEYSGFNHMQPAYETAALGVPSHPNMSNRHSVLMPGPDMSAAPRNQGTGLGTTGMMRDTKARRRESAMVFMGTGGNGAHRKSSMPSIGNVTEE